MLVFIILVGLIITVVARRNKGTFGERTFNNLIVPLLLTFFITTPLLIKEYLEIPSYNYTARKTLLTELKKEVFSKYPNSIRLDLIIEDIHKMNDEITQAHLLGNFSLLVVPFSPSLKGEDIINMDYWYSKLGGNVSGE